MVISVRPLANAGAADYYLERDAGCQAEYYLDPQEAAGRWMGRGAEMLELLGPLDQAGELAFRRLLSGVHPRTGARLVAPVMRAAPAGRLPGRPLVQAIAAAARRQGLPDARHLFGSDRLAENYLRLAASVRRRPFARTLEPRTAGALAEAAGVDPVEIYRDASTGTDVFTPAVDHAADQVDVRNAGYDVCVSAPKSVSTLFALSSPGIATLVRSSHDTAVRTALAYLEREARHGLRGHQGDGQRAQRVKTDGFVGAAFGHRTSRANDPQLHTHVVLANVLRGRDGRWSAIDSRALIRHAQAASYVYHATLRSELTQRLGVAWTRVDRGVAEIVGVPVRLVEAFSTRSREIDNELAVLGRDDPAAAQRACLKTRAPKEHVDEAELRRQWAATATALGHDPATVVEAAIGRSLPAQIDRERLVRELTGPTGLTRHRTTADRRDVLQAVCQALPPGATVDLDALDRLSAEVTSSAAVVHLAAGVETGPRYSTAELVAAEQQALATADALRHCVTGRRGALVLHDGLSAEQRELVMNLIDDRGLCVVVGPAGSGKTTALAAAHRGWRAAGVPVYGAAVSAIAARGLQRATRIPSMTLERLLQDLDAIDPRTRRPAGVAAGSVLVIDEASMVDTRTMDRLLEHAHRSQARLVLVGDPEQLPEIEAGGVFRALAERPSALRIRGNIRQAMPWERDALARLREGRVADALASYSDAGRVHVLGSPRELRDALVDAYLIPGREAPGEGIAVLATSRREVQQLNEAIRSTLRQRGALGPETVTVPIGPTAREFAVGDVVMVTRNHYAHGVLNGMRGRVVSVDGGSGSLVMTDGSGVEHRLDASLLRTGDVQHAYAMTVHKAQGATLDVALVSGSSTLRREAGYVAMSRGRTANYLFVTEEDLRTHAPEVAELHDAIALDALQRRLERSGAHRLASSYRQAQAMTHEMYQREPMTRGRGR